MKALSFLRDNTKRYVAKLALMKKRMKLYALEIAIWYLTEMSHVISKFAITYSSGKIMIDLEKWRALMFGITFNWFILMIYKLSIQVTRQILRLCLRVPMQFLSKLGWALMVIFPRARTMPKL